MAVTVGIGVAGTLYAVRTVHSFAAGGLRPGVWDLTASVITDVHLTAQVLLTAVLLRAVVRRDAVAPEMLRLGTYRSIALAEARSAAADVVPPGIAILLGCWGTACIAGLPWRVLDLPGSAVAAFAAAGVPWPLGLLLQVTLVTATLSAVQLLIGAVRIVTGSGIPGVGLAFVLWGWMGVSVLGLSLTLKPGQSSAGIAEGLTSSAPALLNSGTYLGAIITLQEHALFPVVVVITVCTMLSIGAAQLKDLRVRRARLRIRPKNAALQPVGGPDPRLHQHTRQQGERA